MDFRFRKVDLERDEEMVREFVTKHFGKNPLQVLLPAGDEMSAAINGLIASGKDTILAFYGDELVGCRTGSIKTYDEMIKVTNVEIELDLLK